MMSGGCGSATTDRVPSPGLTGKYPVSRRGRSVDVYENPDRVHGSRGGASAGEDGSGDFDVERDGAEVRHDAEADDVDVRVGDAARPHRLRRDAGPIVELAIDLDR